MTLWLNASYGLPMSQQPCSSPLCLFRQGANSSKLSQIPTACIKHTHAHTHAQAKPKPGEAGSKASFWRKSGKSPVEGTGDSRVPSQAGRVRVVGRNAARDRRYGAPHFSGTV